LIKDRIYKELLLFAQIPFKKIKKQAYLVKIRKLMQQNQL